MRHRHRPGCGCHACKTIVHPTKYNCVNQYSESTVNHVHPSHTTVMNHHTVKNNHVFPHSTSVQNSTNSVDSYGGSFNVPAGPGNQVAGAMSPGMGPGPGAGPGNVAGAMSPGAGPGNQVAGANHPGMGPGNHHHGPNHCGPNHWKKPNKWC